MSIQPHPSDKLIEQIGALFDQIRSSDFPALIPEWVEDDGETFPALRCPRCGYLVESDDFYAVSFAEHWTSANDLEGDATHERSRIYFSNDEIPELEDTLYYRHDDHAVSLPDGWREDWQ